MFVLHYISPRMNIAYKEKNQTRFMLWWSGGFRKGMVELSYEKTPEAMVLIWWQQWHHTKDVLASTMSRSANVIAASCSLANFLESITALK